jgi:outer membrane protein W
MYILKTPAVFLIFVVLLCSGLKPVFYHERVRVVAEEANIRKEPNLNSDILAVIKKGTLLPVYKILGEWYEVLVRFEGSDDFIHGFIHASMVDVIPEDNKPLPLPDRPVQEMKDLRTGGKFSLGFSFGAVSLLDKNYGSSPKIGVEIIYAFTESFSAKLSYHGFGVNVDRSEGGLHDGVLTIDPIQFSMKMKLPFYSQYNPYVAAGIGYYFNHFSLDDELDFTRKEEVKNSIGIHIGGGTDYYLRENLVLNLDLLFYFSKTSGNYEFLLQPGNIVDKGSVENLHIHGYIISLGVRYIF